MANAPRFISSEETAYIELLFRDLDAKSRQRALRNRSHPPGQTATWAGIVGSRLLARAAVMRAQA